MLCKMLICSLCMLVMVASRDIIEPVEVVDSQVVDSQVVDPQVVDSQITDSQMTGSQISLEVPIQNYLEELWIYPLKSVDPSYLAGINYETLLRIVEAEAGGEDKKGKMLVAGVVLNRVDSSEFPDTVVDVVYQVAGGSVQFTPVADGRIDTVQVSEETVEAVKDVLSGDNPAADALYFMAPRSSEEQNISWFQTHLTYLFSWGGHDFYGQGKQ